MNKIMAVVILLFNFFPNNAYSQSLSVNLDGSTADSSAILDVKSSSKGIMIPRVSNAEKNAIASPAVGLLVFQTNTDSGFYYYNGSTWIKIGEKSRHYIGELFQGGIIYWVNEASDHGLIASLVNLSTSTAWSNITNVEVGVAAQSTWNGQGNSNAIMAQPGHTNSAAKLCNDYSNINYGTGVYSDWYLPSVDELHMIFMSRFMINKIITTTAVGDVVTDDGHWSSSEAQIAGYLFADTYWPYFSGGFGRSSKDTKYIVRAVRSF